MEQTEISFDRQAENSSHDGVEDMIEKITATGDYKVLRRLKPREQYQPDAAVEKKIAIYIDTETTGFDIDEQEIIEIAMVPFEYDDEGNIYRVLPEYNALQDPGFPIPEIITQVTHITDDMVKGQSIDWEVVGRMLSTADLVIAHNASFDRPFVEKYLSDFENIAWACSIRDVDWNDEGFEGVKLEYLAYKYGFFYEGHRATIDCLAGIELLSNALPATGDRAFKRLLDTSNKVIVRLWAQGAPFEKRIELKKRGYRWSSGDDGRRKAWYTDIPEADLKKEMEFLNEKIYPKHIKSLPQDRITAKERYSRRV